jgi:hypothetical protein
MLPKAKNGHANVYELFKLNYIATYNITGRSSKQDSEKNTAWFCVKKVSTLPHLTVSKEETQRSPSVFLLPIS